MNMGGVKLKAMYCDGDAKILEYSVANSNGKTTVEQKLILENLGEKWVARIENDGFPSQESAKDAAHKLGDWLVRLGQSINEESAQFETIKL